MINVLLIQNPVKERINETLKQIEEMLLKYENQDIDFIVFPEMFMCPYQIESFSDYAQNDVSMVTEWLKIIARKFSSYVIGGSVPEKNENKIYNTSYIFDRDGTLINKYRKNHLFSVKYPDGSIFRESDILSSGEDIGVFNTEFGKMGVMICFDVRFPTMAENIRKKAAKIIFIPAAFNKFTGPLHWEVTFRSRAIDNQLFVFGVSPSSDSYGSYETYGHTIAVDPWGKVIYQFSENKDAQLISINLDDIEKARTAIPIVNNQKKGC